MVGQAHDTFCDYVIEDAAGCEVSVSKEVRDESSECLRRLKFFFFFFQAEDGIRDTSVTGVQTCALPICTRVVLILKCVDRRGRGSATASREEGREHRGCGAGIGTGRGRSEHAARHDRDVRSEERRVGKECRSRWWREE